MRSKDLEAVLSFLEFSIFHCFFFSCYSELAKLHAFFFFFFFSILLFSFFPRLNPPFYRSQSLWESFLSFTGDLYSSAVTPRLVYLLCPAFYFHFGFVFEISRLFTQGKKQEGIRISSFFFFLFFFVFFSFFFFYSL